MSDLRHHDSTSYLRQFSTAILVRCPACNAPAHLRYSDEPRLFRLVCTACGRSRDWARQANGGFWWPGAGPHLRRFDLDLWLQVPCCGSTLWAYNEAHLDELESFVRATLRSRERHPEYGWSNASMTSRLPKWLKSAKNRPAVLRGLQELRALLGSAA